MYDFLLIFGKTGSLAQMGGIELAVDEASSGFNISIEHILQVGFNHFRSAPGIFILYSIVAAAAFSNPVSGLILGGPVVTGYYIVAYRLKHGIPAEVPDFFRSFDRFVPLMILNLLLSLAIFLGFLLLVIPGIFLAVSFMFAHFFVWFYEVHPQDALRLSRKLVKGNFAQVFLLWLILVGVNVLGGLAFGVGLLVSIPFTFCVLYAAFEDLIGIP
jgi:uncharacterized membrane protein